MQRLTALTLGAAMIGLCALGHKLINCEGGIPVWIEF